MTAKEFLNQAYRLNDYINSLKAEKEQLRDIALNITTELSGERKAKNNQDGKVCGTISKIIDFEKQINAETDVLIELKKEIHNKINSLYDNTERLVLRYRYIEFLAWEDISDKMNYSTSQVYRIHEEALKKLNMRVNDSK